MKNESESVGQFVSVSDLQPHPKNPRHNNEAVQSIANSIKRFGFTSPIIANADGTILCGHTRFKASKSLGLETVPVIYVDLNPTDAELLMIADNKLGEKAEWNTDKLSSLLIDLKEQGEDLEVLGFEDSELDDLLGSLSDDEPFGDGDPEPADYQEHESDLSFQLLKGNCLDTLKTLESNSIDAIVTDPPYELGFMGKSWDSTGIAYSLELWSECFRVLKPGAHLVAFSGSRTVFPMGVALADAGFEVRDMISWIYTSGFPKGVNISKAIDKMNGTFEERKKVGEKKSGIRNAEEEKVLKRHTVGASKSVVVDITEPASEEAKRWHGWSTALKPAHEPAVLCRKPIDPDCKNIAENVLKWGTGAINIDASRFEYGDDCWFGDKEIPDLDRKIIQRSLGDDVVGVGFGARGMIGVENDLYKEFGRWPANIYQCSKPQRTEKEQGLDHLAKRVSDSYMGEGETRLDGNPNPERANFHPTVKPQKLMRWLCRLLCPPNGTVLDPFLGSGTTAVSAILEGFNAVGCEMTEDYFPIIEGRVNWAMGERNKGINGTENETQ